MKARFYACPVVWDKEDGQHVALFLDREVGEAVLNSVPPPPQGEWKLFPMNELEVLGWLREQRASGITGLMLNPTPNFDKPATAAVYVADLPRLLDSGKTLELLRELAQIEETRRGGPSGKLRKVHVMPR
jgi:hypothetical protein